MMNDTEFRNELTLALNRIACALEILAGDVLERREEREAMRLSLRAAMAQAEGSEAWPRVVPVGK